MAEYPVLKLSELGVGTMQSVSAGGRNIVIFRDDAGSVSALEDRCSHANVKLSRGKFEGGKVTCPAHGAQFEACSGKQLCMPAVTPVKRYEVKVVGDDIVVVVG